MPVVSSDLFKYFKPTRTEIPGVASMSPPEAVAPPAGGIRALAGVAEKVTRDASVFAKKLQAQINDDQYGKAVARFHVKRTEREIEADKLDPTEAPEYVKTNLDKDAAGIADDIISDPAIRKRFQNYAATLAAQSFSRVAWNARKRQVDELTAGLFEDFDNNLQVLNRRPQDWQIIEREIIRRIDEGTRNGIFDPVKAQTYKAGLQEKVDEMRAKGLLAEMYGGRVPPEQALAAINDTSDITRLDPVRRQELIRQFEQTAHYLAQKAVQDAEREERREERERNRRWQENYDALYARVNDFLMGQGKESEHALEGAILQAGRDRRIRGAQAHSLLTLLKGDDPATEDMADYIEAYEGAVDGSMLPEDIALLPGLSRSTKAGLIDRAISYREKERGKEFAEEVNQYRELIKNSMPLDTWDKAGANRLLARAYVEFEGIMDEARERGEAPDPEKAALQVIEKYGDPRVQVNAMPNIIIHTPNGNLAKRPTTDRDALMEYARLADQYDDQEAAKTILYLLGLSALEERRLSISSPEKAKEIMKKGKRK